MCVQIRQEWDLAADMPLTRAGWGIIYPLIVHDEHPDVHEYDKAFGPDEIVVGERKEPVDAAAAQRNKKLLKRVKREDEADDERGGPEDNKGILELKRQLEAKAKKPRH